jgi:2,3-dihydroxybenzoate-AMP ligase
VRKGCAYLVLQASAGPLTVDSLGRHLLAEGLAKYKLPERVEIVPELPLTNVGKVSKKLLREDIERKLAAEAEEEK